MNPDMKIRTSLSAGLVFNVISVIYQEVNMSKRSLDFVKMRSHVQFTCPLNKGWNPQPKDFSITCDESGAGWYFECQRCSSVII